MKVTITSTSQTLQQLLSATDYGILEAYYKQDSGGGGGIIRHVGVNRVYIETGKTATTTDSFWIDAEEVLSIGFRGGILATQFRTASGTSDLLLLF